MASIVMRDHAETSTMQQRKKQRMVPATQQYTVATPTGKSLGDLNQELFLRILSFLPCSDLARVQSVDHYWQSMSLDPQLWKRLYMSRYAHPHHSQLIPSRLLTSSNHHRHNQNSSAQDMRPIKRLPSRAFPPPSPSRAPSPNPSSSARKDAIDKVKEEAEQGWGIRHDGVDWKQMLKVGLNWANGNASLQSLPFADHDSASVIHDSGTTPSKRDRGPYSPHIIALAPSYILTAHMSSPLLHIYPSPSATTSSSSSSPTLPPASTGALGVIPPPPGWSTPKKPDAITTVCVDQASSVEEESTQGLPARVAVFYNSGGFVVLHLSMLSTSKLAWRRIAVSPPLQRRRLTNDPVVLAQFHYPVLLSCTMDFRVSVYALPGAGPGYGGEKPRLLQSMQSQVSFHPATLSLLPLDPDPDAITPATASETKHFHAALTYSTPLYPRSWTIAVQELFIDLNTSTSLHLVRRGECWHVGRSAADGITGFSGARGWPRRAGSNASPIVGVRGERAVGVGTDGRWCVLAGEDNQIQVYALPLPGSGTSAAPITHTQTLLAHSAAVTSISLSAGRCVSGGRDGRVLVWELDATEDGRDEFKFVEVRQGGRPRRVAVGDDAEEEDEDGTFQELPHPQSIATAARTLFLSQPPSLPPAINAGSQDLQRELRQPPLVIKQLAFDEQKIVGLVLNSVGGIERDEVMRVWSFAR